jgi:hypothetical protein
MSPRWHQLRRLGWRIGWKDQKARSSGVMSIPGGSGRLARLLPTAITAQ